MNIFNPFFWRSFIQRTRLAWNLMRDPRVAQRLKLIPIFTLVYIISPFDIIPGFIPVLGQLDDIAIFLFGLNLFLRMVPPEIVREYQAGEGKLKG
jgi:uncharacterized membrane protein YkvA (DUF1232 family)